MTPTDPYLENKRKNSEKYEKIHKKSKVDQSSSVIGLTDDDYNLISDNMEEVANESCINMDARHKKLVSSIIDLLQILCIAVK